MDHGSVEDGAACRLAAIRWHRIELVKDLHRGRRDVVLRAEMHQLPVEELDVALHSVTQQHGGSNDGVEHRLYIRRRATDDAEDLGRGRLLLMRDCFTPQRRRLALQRLCQALLKVVTPGAVALRCPADDRALAFAFRLSRLCTPTDRPLLVFHWSRNCQELHAASGAARRPLAKVPMNARRFIMGSHA